MTEEVLEIIKRYKKEFKETTGMTLECTVVIPDKLVKCMLDTVCRVYDTTSEELEKVNKNLAPSRTRQMLTLLSDHYGLTIHQWSSMLKRDRTSYYTALSKAESVFNNSKKYREEFFSLKEEFQKDWSKIKAL